jgi:hypothetical protein
MQFSARYSFCLLAITFATRQRWLLDSLGKALHAFSRQLP